MKRAKSHFLYWAIFLERLTASQFFDWAMKYILLALGCWGCFLPERRAALVRHKEMVCMCSVSEEIKQQKPAAKGLLPGRQEGCLPKCLQQPACDIVTLSPPPHSLMTFSKVAKESFGLPWKPDARKNQENSSP